MSRRAMLRRVVGGTLAWATAAAALAVAAALFFGAHAGRAVARQGEHRLLDLAAALAGSIAPEEADIAVQSAPEARFAREIRSQLVALRRNDASIRRILLLEAGSKGDPRVLLEVDGGRAIEPAGAGAGAAPEPRPDPRYHAPAGISLEEADRKPVVSPAAGAAVIAAFAPVKDERGRTVAVAGIEMDGGAIAAAAKARRAQTAAAAGVLVLGIASFAAWRARRGLAALDRLRGLRAQVAIYRVGDALARAESDEELVRLALDAIASGSGIDRWTMYLRDAPGARFRRFAERGAEAGGKAPAEPRPAGPGVVSIPLVDGAETVGVLQCLLPGGREPESDELALFRWMATQVLVGLKRIRMERRDQMLALFTMGTGEILLGLDLGGLVTYANAAAERALGAAPGGLTGRPLESMAMLGAGEEPFGLVGALDGEREFSGEVCFVRADGSRFPAEVRLSPAVDRQGKLSALVLLGHDVTERREREADLENRTRELALLNEQLQRAVAELEEARQAQSEFVANTSHELRTPLNAVIGFASLIEQGNHESEAEARDFAQRIRTSAEHLLGLLNDILDLAKVEAGRFQLSMTDGDVRGPVREALDAVASLAASRGLAIAAELPEGPLPARLDPVRARQVLLNLLGNALKYTDKGGV
ncbi:MAG TPA: histidine kinase dimerization/phospho-acceptor domain-containing protein, partial [Candidatus Eisenbacteria bacterium]|nr:histidine kinase dimerization/phospho-acceptor domain-containing protein [Candidatus Eisenbacteria bacterium]